MTKTEAVEPEPEVAAPRTFDEEDIRLLVSRLSRRHKSGGRVIERAAILAEGAGCDAILAWIDAHGGEPEARVPARAGSRGGLHSARNDAGSAATERPLRYVLPAGALD